MVARKWQSKERPRHARQTGINNLYSMTDLESPQCMAVHRGKENRKRDCAIRLARMDRIQREAREKGERIRRENKGRSAARVDSSGI